ncbi:MAG: GtrA family protein [Firmicutes bacterium]|nr:GtrA family protein [Bacillota bacterium]
MSEFIKILLSFDFKKIFFEKTDNGLLKFFRYAFVGGIAFVADYLGFALTSLLLGDGDTAKEMFSVLGKAFYEEDVFVAVATTVGFMVGLTVNFILSKKFVFTEQANVKSGALEFAAYTVIGIIGYFLNIVLMLAFIKYVNKYLSKIIVAAIVLIYNYMARKILLYSDKGDNKK